jgi:DNA-binding CsgD family transcriptional regulator
VLDSISAPRRLVLHRLVLEALRRSPLAESAMARLAYHADAAHDPAAVLAYAPGAARQAASANAHHDAAQHFALALRYAAGLPPAEHAALQEAYAWECNLIEQRAAGAEARRQAAELWREAGQPLRQGENLAQMMILLVAQGRHAEAEQMSQAALRLLEPLPPGRELALAYRSQAVLRMFDRDVSAAITWGEKARVLAEQAGDPHVLALVLNTVGTAWLFADYERGRAYLERSLAAARQAGQDAHAANAITNLAAASAELFQFERAEGYLADGLAFCTEHDFDAMRLYMLAWQAATHLYRGRWDAAGEAAAAVVGRADVSKNSRVTALVVLGRLRARRGDPGVWEALDEALTLAEGMIGYDRVAHCRAARAEAAWLEDQPKRAAEEALAAFDAAASKGHPWLAGELALWRARAGEEFALPEAAARPFRLELAGDWQAAAAAWETLGCPYEQARALAEGDTAAQRAALAVFEALGARPAAARLRHKLRAAGARDLPRGPRPATQAHPFGLTARQAEVLAWLGSDLTNAQIAAHLHLSPKTVDHHVSAVLAKLGVGTRAAAARLAAEHGLSPPTKPGARRARDGA